MASEKNTTNALQAFGQSMQENQSVPNNPIANNSDSNPFGNIDMKELEENMKKMQADMQTAYSNLADIQLNGKSEDNALEIILSATYELIDIKFDEQALQGGMQEFQWRIREAWNNALKQVQKTTQSKTMELFEGMIPEDIRKMAEEAATEQE